MARAKSSYRVIAYHLNGKLFKVFENAKEASSYLNAHPRYIDKCIRDQNLTAFNYMWRRYPYDEIPKQIEPLKRGKKSTKRKAVALIDNEGNVIETYDSIKQASLSNNVDTHSLRDNLNHKVKTVKGKTFRYI